MENSTRPEFSWIGTDLQPRILYVTFQCYSRLNLMVTLNPNVSRCHDCFQGHHTLCCYKTVSVLLAYVYLMWYSDIYCSWLLCVSMYSRVVVEKNIQNFPWKKFSYLDLLLVIASCVRGHLSHLVICKYWNDCKHTCRDPYTIAMRTWRRCTALPSWLCEADCLANAPTQ